MTLQSPAQAIRQARRLLDIPEGDEGTAMGVRRLDRPELGYFLVHVGGRVAAVGSATGGLMASAQSARPPLSVAREAAIARAGLGGRATAELVWAPSAVSLSMFDPIWEVAADGRTLYVDQRGAVWDSLSAKRPGGG